MEVIGRPVGPPRPPTLPLSTEQLHRLHGLMAGLDWPGVTPLVAA
jgi:hypothetical protein